jgi:predicted transcriptional regulator
MDDQLTLRLPGDLARRLSSRARDAGVKRSAVVREALIAYLGPDAGTAKARAAKPLAVRERLAPFVGAVALDRPALERDQLAQRLREHNWRE